MKKIILLIIMTLFISGCTINKVEEEINTPQEEVKEEEIVPTYTDENPIKIGLYSRKTGYYVKLTEYKTSIKNSTDINTFQILPLDDEQVTYTGKFQNYVKGLWDNITTEYKLGINLKYSLIDGTNVSHTLYDPSNILEHDQHIQVYLYDAIAHMNDKFYSHITMEEFDENTYITSFKLTAGAHADEIVYPVTISVFTYDTEDDFDEEGNYRGNSIYTIELSNE